MLPASFSGYRAIKNIVMLVLLSVRMHSVSRKQIYDRLTTLSRVEERDTGNEVRNSELCRAVETPRISR